MARHQTRISCLIVGLLLASLAGCGSKDRGLKSNEPLTVEEEKEELLPVVDAADTKAERQLLAGFYALEAGSWRWTAKEFSVLLPALPAPKGARLLLHFTLPDPVVRRFGRVRLAGRAGEFLLAPETYSSAGSQVYQRDLPASVLLGESLRVDFQLDRALPPGPVDRRELGLVFHQVEIQSR